MMINIVYGSRLLEQWMIGPNSTQEKNLEPTYCLQ